MDKNRIKISVIVPIYNAEKTLKKCINSILSQTYTNFELILVNDGSKDGSVSLCENYSKKDSRVVVINKKNEGCIKARKAGIDKANGQYIMFVDSDDWIDINTLKLVSDEINKNNSDVIVFNMNKVIGRFGYIKRAGNREYFTKKQIFKGDEIKRELASAYLHGHPFPANLCGKVYKNKYLRECGKYLDKLVFLGEDLYYNIEIFLKINKVSIINKELYYYRVGGNTSKYMEYLFSDMINGYMIQKEVIEEYYQDTKQQRYNGISIMLLNTLKTCLQNIFLSKLTDSEIKRKIKEYINDAQIIEASSNIGAINYFEKEFIYAIKQQDVEFLYNYGNELYKKNKIRRSFVSIINFIL